jgi:hypothetical protein
VTNPPAGPPSGKPGPTPPPAQPGPRPGWAGPSADQQPAPEYGPPQYRPPQYGPPQYGPPQYGPPQYGPPPPWGSPPPPGSGGSGKGPLVLTAVGGLMVLLLVVGLVVLAVTDGDEEAPTGSGVEAQDRSVADIAVGDCFDDDEALEEEEFDSLPVVPCEQAHDNEVYALVELPREPWPGDDAVFESSLDACESEFERYVGEAYDDSELEYFLAVPTEDAWALGDRTVRCSLYSYSERLSGSMRGSGR